MSNSKIYKGPISYVNVAKNPMSNVTNGFIRAQGIEQRKPELVWFCNVFWGKLQMLL